MNGESIVVQKGTSGNFSLALGLISSSVKSVVWNRIPLESQHYSSIQHGVRRLQDGISSLSFISCVVLGTSLIYNSKAQFPYMKKWKYLWLSYSILLAVGGWRDGAGEESQGHDSGESTFTAPGIQQVFSKCWLEYIQSILFIVMVTTDTVY